MVARESMVWHVVALKMELFVWKNRRDVEKRKARQIWTPVRRVGGQPHKHTSAHRVCKYNNRAMRQVSRKACFCTIPGYEEHEEATTYELREPRNAVQLELGGMKM